MKYYEYKEPRNRTHLLDCGAIEKLGNYVRMSKEVELWKVKQHWPNKSLHDNDNDHILGVCLGGEKRWESYFNSN